MSQRSLKEMQILIVDDQEANVALLRQLLAGAGYTQVAGTQRPEDVIAMFAEAPPQLLLLDLHMPRLDGFEVMSRLAPLAGESLVPPILVLTADVTPEARRRALDLGASDFVSKPFDASEVLLRVRNLLHSRLMQLQLEDRGVLLEQLVRARTADLEATRLEILDRLAIAAEYRDDDTHEHARRIGRTAALLARELGLPEARIDQLRRAAPLHDIGKIGVPDHILLKPGKLTAAEFEEIKRHPAIGAGILSGSRAPILKLAEEIALAHHERWDGTGYPNGLSADAIPIAGRIVAVADVFDALTHRRPYKEPWPLEGAVAEIVGQSARQFDPEAVRAFERLDHTELIEPIEEVSVSSPVVERLDTPDRPVGRAQPAAWIATGASPGSLRFATDR